MTTKIPALLTIDLEDYRRQELRDHQGDSAPNPAEVQRQLDGLLELLDRYRFRATFFTVGRLASELSRGIWRHLIARHELGCHGHEHLSVRRLGEKGFYRDLLTAKSALEDVSGNAVHSFRAPYFSSDGCDPWFGEALARAQFRLDSSQRLGSPPPGFAGTLPLTGAGGAVQEVPLPSIGRGLKRLTVIGGTYFRLLPLRVILKLLRASTRKGFFPIVYLHPYDLDPSAPPLEYERFRHWVPRLGDWIRRIGRGGVADKLRGLAQFYDFHPLEYVLGRKDTPPASGVAGALCPSLLAAPTRAQQAR